MRALVVENQRPLVNVLAACLDEEGFQVDACQEAEEADFRVRATCYDLILLSLTLPNDQGFALLKQWRAGGLSAPVLVLSAVGSVAERVNALDLGADDYLARPFRLPELMARVRALMRRAHRVADPVLRICDLEIDTATRSVRRSGRDIRLTRREYSLLLFLAFNRGKVLTRTMIWEHLYNEQNESTSNVVDVYIRYLRNKLDKGFDPPLILTRWGEGYMMRSDDRTTASA
jgi:DNA-binding response OmpR family regulator